MNREEMKEVDSIIEDTISRLEAARVKLRPGPATPGVEVGTLPQTGFRFSVKSERELVGVHPMLVECTRDALFHYATQDFAAHDGLRTTAEQRQHVANGASRTMNSKHLRQSDGFGHAVDLVPWINGGLKWDWDGCAKIAYAMDQAATRLGIADKIVWGGAWDRTLADYGSNLDSYMEEVHAYKKRHPGPDFIDGPHFEIRP